MTLLSSGASQAKLLLGDNNGLTPGSARTKPTLVPHAELEAYLGRYSGLMLYLKEMDESVYGKLCAVSLQNCDGGGENC